jgi:hypothetical protein
LIIFKKYFFNLTWKNIVQKILKLKLSNQTKYANLKE